jgi:hypothetical protein
MNFLASTASVDMKIGLTVKQLLAIAIPIMAIQVGLIIAALVSLSKLDPAGLRGGKGLWIAVLIVSFFSTPLGLLGPILYFTIGRKPYERD